MSENLGFTMMAWAGKNNAEPKGNFSIYTGIDPVRILAVNPTEKEIEELCGYTPKQEREYTGVNNDVQYAKITFLVMNDFFEHPILLPMYLRNEGELAQNGKRKVIDKYGRTAWVTQEELASHAIPVDKNGNPLRIDAEYVPAYNGQDNLINLLRAYSGIVKVEKFVDNQYAGLIDNPELAEVPLKKIPDYFKGDVSEIKEIISYNPDNMVRVMLGARESNDNIYQDWFIHRFESPNVTNDIWFENELAKQKGIGRYANTSFSSGHFKKFEVTPTDFSTPQNQTEEADPWA